MFHVKHRKVVNMYIGGLEVLTMSEHNKRAHMMARKLWILDGRKNYRKHFGKCMQDSMLLNYCYESLPVNERLELKKGMVA